LGEEVLGVRRLDPLSDDVVHDKVHDIVSFDGVYEAEGGERLRLLT
jgi:hypothetical protein